MSTLGPIQRFLFWVENHDDSRAFVFLYIGSALLLSILVSLFWLVFAVGVHFAMEWFKQYRLISSSYYSITIRVFWELLLDIGLVFFALVLVLYIDIIFGIAGISASARAGTQGIAKIGTRFAGWQRIIRGLLLSVDDVIQVGRTVVSKNNASDDRPINETKSIWGGWLLKWSIGNYFVVCFTIVCFLLLVLSPVLSNHNLCESVQIILTELHPFP